MSAISQERLYSLLPAVYRLRDSAQGEPLRALLALVQEQYDGLEQNIAGLYENWFIETCDEWVVPYIGDLLGVRLLNAASPGTFSARAYVAHTLDYRRRKGTAAVVEQLARDVTGWPARVVEYFELLATTQYINHLRPQNVITPDLRHANALELLGGPFETAAHTVDVRHIATRHRRYNIPDLGIFLWRLQDYFVGPIASGPTTAVRQSDAREVAAPADGRYTFNPLGLNSPLCNRPQTEIDNVRLADEINVPGLLRRRPLYDELEALRQSEVDGQPAPVPVYFGANPVFALHVDGKPIPFDQVMICDIADISATDWRRPAASKKYSPSNGGAAVDKPIALSVDPVRGRIAFPVGVKVSTVEVAYAYLFSGDVGAGPYDRTEWLTGEKTGPGPLHNSKRWQVAISKELAPVANLVFPTFAAAVQAWNAQPAGTDGVIAIQDSRTYIEDLTGANGIVIPEGSRLLIVAADWPALRQLGAPSSQSLDPNGFRPHVRGNLAVLGKAPASSETQGTLFIDGLLLEGTLTVESGNLGVLGLSHSTIDLAHGLKVLSSGAAGGDNAALTVNAYRTICGPVAITKSLAALNIADSSVSSGIQNLDSAPAIVALDSAVDIQTTTVFGTTQCRTLNAGNSIFTGIVAADRRQTGCVRYSSVPAGSKTARRYYCQPDRAVKGVFNAAEREAIRARLAPQFTSLDPGQPSFAQLSARCAVEISTGAEDGSEMGAFKFLLQPQRRTNLVAALDEYLRFGIEAGMIEET